MARLRFQDKVVLITGAQRGFGGIAADRFAAEGARLVLCDISSEGIAAKAAALKSKGALVEFLAADVSQEETHIALVGLALKAYGRLDIALNNAGIVHPSARLPDIDSETMRRQFEVNVMGVFLGMKHQIPAMLKGGGGAITNTASVAGVLGATGLSAYVASKHAVVGLTKTAAGEFAAKGVRVNAVCPGIADTAMADELLGQMGRGDPQAGRDKFEALLPAKRMARPEEIVEAMLFSSDPANSYMNGHCLLVDGAVTAV
jgi:NAD(P)-dependent dehydrogenase (short-subunit alcohol dehydrogenase family)